MHKNGQTGGRCAAEEKAAAVRIVRIFRARLRTDRETARRVALQLGFGVEPVRSWVRHADIDDGVKPGVGSDASAEVQRLQQELREMELASEILKRTPSFSGTDFHRQHRMQYFLLTQTKMTFSMDGNLESSSSVGVCQLPSMRQEAAPRRRGL